MKQIAEWMVGNHTGSSSKTMAAIALGAQKGNFDAPYDGDDFGRCKLLVETVPEIRDHFGRIAELVPTFAGIIREWDTLCSIYDRDAATGHSSDLYQRIQTLRGGH